MEVNTKQRVLLLKRHAFSWQPPAAFAVLALNLLFLYFLRLIRVEYSLLWAFALAFGFVLQRSRFCFAAAFRDLFLIKSTSLTRAVLLSLALTTLGFAALQYLSLEHGVLAAQGRVMPVGMHTVLGGGIFGIGMVIAGGCVTGVLMRVGEGHMMQGAALVGLLAGSALGSFHFGWWYHHSIKYTSAIFLPDYLGWGGALVIQILVIVILYALAFGYSEGWKKLFRAAAGKNEAARREGENGRRSPSFRQKVWSYRAGGTAIALLNVLLLASWGRPWGITTAFACWAAWFCRLAGASPYSWAYFNLPQYSDLVSLDFFWNPSTFLTLGVIFGAFLSSLAASEFRLRWVKSPRYLAAAVAGGTMMGYGARLAMGCNIGAFLSGAGSMSLHGWVFGASLLAGAFCGGKLLIRYLL